MLGWESWSGMMLASDGKMYGTCAAGGQHGGGVIFKIDPTNDQYYDIYDFDNTNGGNPYGGLKEFSDGKLYGASYMGGANNLGVIYSFDPATSVYTKLYVFDGASGANPRYGDLTEGADGKIYGVTSMGGANGVGVVFSFDLATGTFTNMHDFDGATGSSPYGGLVQASNGILYGMTSAGGSNSLGVLFSINPATNAYTDLLDFNGTNGSMPNRSLTVFGNTLFGTTNQGGATGEGVSFSFDFATNTYTKQTDFSSLSTGSHPHGEITVVAGASSAGVGSLNGEVAISIYPNPASNVITVSNSVNEEVINFTDVLGKQIATVKTSALAKTTVDITTFPSVFFAKTNSGTIQKIVRQ